MNRTNVKSLADLLKLSAEEYGAKAFIREKADGNIAESSFADLYKDCMRVNGFLKSKGKVHAAVMGVTSYNYLVGWFGTVIGGNTAVPLDAQLSCEDICDLIRRADVNVFFYDERFEKMLPHIKTACPSVDTYICLGRSSQGELALSEIIAKNPPSEPDEIDPDTTAAIVYTSGTTGKSKGVMLSHGNFVDNTFCSDGEATSEDVLLTVLPIHHVYCFTCDILLSLRYGATVCVNDSMMRIAQNLKLFQPTIILLVPMIAATIYKQIKAAAAAKPDIPVQAIANAVFGGRLKGIYSGGAYLDPELIKAYAELGIPIAQGYGMTECSPRISSVRFQDGSFGDVGIVVKGCEIKVADGEITVKSPSVMKGYYKDTAATADALSADGWLHTGDLGYVKNNRIYITGRKKNLIILSNGENVSPEELENKYSSADIVSEVLVYDEDGVITAEIYPSAEYCGKIGSDQIPAAIRELTDKINSSVSSSKAIRRIRLRELEFEKTTSKKVKRNQSSKGAII